jgi:hypothetical protein
MNLRKDSTHLLISLPSPSSCPEFHYEKRVSKTKYLLKLRFMLPLAILAGIYISARLIRVTSKDTMLSQSMYRPYTTQSLSEDFDWYTVSIKRSFPLPHFTPYSLPCNNKLLCRFDMTFLHQSYSIRTPIKDYIRLIVSSAHTFRGYKLGDVLPWLQMRSPKSPSRLYY